MALTLPKVFWPVTVVTGVNDKVYFQSSDGVPHTATVAAGTYYSAVLLAAAVQAALNAAAAWTWVVSVGATGRITISDQFSILLGRTSGTNELLYSQQFDNAAWTKTTGTTVTPNAATAPDGTATADRVNYDGSGTVGSFRIYQSVSVAPAGAFRVASIWLKAAAPLSLQLGANIGGPIACSVTTSWQQFYVVGTGNGSSATQLLLYSASGSNAAFSVDVWQGQIEPGQVPGVTALTTGAALSPATNPLHEALGFSDNIGVGVASVTSPNQHQNGWYADRPVADDTGDLPTYERAQALALGGQTYGLDFGTRYSRLVSLVGLNSYKTWKADEGAAHPNEALERLLDNGWQRLRWWKDATVEGTYEDLTLDAGKMKTPPRNRLSPGKAMYSLALPFLKFVP